MPLAELWNWHSYDHKIDQLLSVIETTQFFNSCTNFENKVTWYSLECNTTVLSRCFFKSTSVVSIFTLHFQHFRAEIRKSAFVWTEKFPLSLNILWSRNTMPKKVFFFLSRTSPFALSPKKTTKSKNFLVPYFILGKWLLTSFLVSKFIN